MADILEEIIAWKRVEVEQHKARLAEREIHRQVEQMLDGSVPSMKKAVGESASGIIAEFKRKSPSKGWINEQAQAADVPVAYGRNGAAAVSILTDSRYFGGEDAFIAEAREAGLTLPVLYKNFIVDEYQLFEARLAGASAVLLIAAALSREAYRQLNVMAHYLGLETLLETHSAAEIEYADHLPDLCGVNNRNLGTFITSVDNSYRLAPYLPEGVVRVSESGISSPATIRELRKAGYQGFLIGERFMKTDNPGEALRQFVKGIEG